MEPRQVSYADYGSVAFQHHRFSTIGFANLRERLAASIEAAGLWVLQEVDAQALLRRDAYAIGGAVQILAFHPTLMARLLAADPAALLAAPLKFACLRSRTGPSPSVGPITPPRSHVTVEPPWMNSATGDAQRGDRCSGDDR